MATSFDVVPAVEANARTDRVLSVRCPRCGVPAGEKCVVSGQRKQYQHGARWDAWYRTNPETMGE